MVYGQWIPELGIPQSHPTRLSQPITLPSQGIEPSIRLPDTTASTQVSYNAYSARRLQQKQWPEIICVTSTDGVKLQA
jgi:hypothetical protein